MRSIFDLRRRLVMLAVAGSLAGAGAAQEPPAGGRTLFVNEQQSLTPGYAIGNIAIGDPKVADFKVMPGRRELLLYGRGEGTTTLVIWDQRNVRRDEIVIAVRTREAVELERDLREMLAGYPEVEIRSLGGTLALSGTVPAEADLLIVERIALAARVENLVRVAPASAGAIPGRGAFAGGAPAGAPGVRYEIELFEASAQFRSGSYGTGVEPSGRSLFKQTVEAPIGGEATVFIGGAVAAGEEKGDRRGDRTGAAGGAESGLRLTLRPGPPGQNDAFTTFVLIETNLPFSSSTYEPETWRRARWEFATVPGEPFAITGGDLLATPDAGGGLAGGSRMGVVGEAAQYGAARASRFPAAELVPVLGSLFRSRSYQEKKTQLLVVLRPQLASVAAQPE